MRFKGGFVIAETNHQSAQETSLRYEELERELRALKLKNEQLEEALKTRDVIGQAMGILIEREALTPQEAFDKLRIVSQQSNVKLAEIARELVERAVQAPDS